MVYNCKLQLDLEVKECIELELCPEDYLFCESTKDLEYTVEDDLAEYSSYQMVGNASVIDEHLIIPDEFIEKWKQLKSKQSKD